MFKIKRYMEIEPMLLLAFVFFSSVSMALEMSPEGYVAMDLQVRQATLDGVRDRLVLLEHDADLSTQLKQDNETQQTVIAIYASYGVTASWAIAWATRNQQVLVRWLSEHPELQTEYDRIARDLDIVSMQIQQLVDQ